MTVKKLDSAGPHLRRLSEEGEPGHVSDRLRGPIWVLSHFTVEQVAACRDRYPDPSSEAPAVGHVWRGHKLHMCHTDSISRCGGGGRWMCLR